MKPHSMILPFFLVLFLFTVSVFGQSPSNSQEGIWHKTIGGVDFYCVQDAPLELENSLLLTEDEELLNRLAPNGKSPSSFNLFVIQKGSETILIDTGTGGKMLERLEKIGIQPEDVQNILLTHSHGDHVGGLLKDGKRVFPNATLWLNEQEQEFWKSAQNKDVYEKCIEVYGNPKFLMPDEKTTVIFPEMVAVDLPGHTGFLIASDEMKILVAGDFMHSGAVQFARPDINFTFDNDPKLAAETRIKLLKRAVNENLLLVSSHLPFPSAGHVKNDDDGFRFVPVAADSFYDFVVRDIDGLWFRCIF